MRVFINRSPIKSDLIMLPPQACVALFYRGSLTVLVSALAQIDL